jgi:hypothetical protein
MSFPSLSDPSLGERGHFPGPQFPVPAAPLPPEVHVRPPLVYVAATWEYHHLSRPVDEAGAAATLEELATLGRAGWELGGTVSDGQLVHFYFKREPR